MSQTPKKISKSSQRAVDRYCSDYLNDKLSATQRKVIEERISKGDPLIIDTIARLKGETVNITTPKTPEERYQEDLQSFELQDDKILDPTHEPIMSKELEKRKPPKRKSSREAFKAVIKGPKTVLSVFLATIIFSLTLLIMYLQSERTYLNTLLNAQRTLSEEATQLSFNDRSKALKQMNQFLWLKNLLRQDGLVQKQLLIDNLDATPTIVFFHPPSLKLAIIAGEWNIPEDQYISLWSTGSAEPQFIGMMHPIVKDSLYQEWNTSAFLLMENIEFRVGSIKEGAIDYTESTRLISTSLP